MSSPPKPAQAECRRCEKLFCYFQRTTRRLYCGLCVEMERIDLLEFTKTQRRQRAFLDAPAADHFWRRGRCLTV